MITVVSGTNNKESKTSVFAKYCVAFLKGKGMSVKYLDLADLPLDFITPDMFCDQEGFHPGIREIQEEYIVAADKYIILSPEYNGSFPGILKTFIDAISIKENRGGLSHKKACLIGVSAGRSGNQRGMDHLSAVLAYCMVTVYPNKLPISNIHALLENGKLVDESTQETLQKILVDFSVF